MEKKLPSIFVNCKQKSLGNNKKVSYTSQNETRNKKDITTPQNINKKIKDIFNSSNYVYKANVEIKLKNETITAKIVGKNQTHLITLENKLIPIKDIIDIKKITN